MSEKAILHPKIEKELTDVLNRIQYLRFVAPTDAQLDRVKKEIREAVE